jgi:hypothetical protein
MNVFLIIIFSMFFRLQSFAQSSDECGSSRIDYVVPLEVQPHEKSSATIWYDDFDGESKLYAEGSSPLDDSESLGGVGKSMLCFYEKGSKGKGNRKVFFGDSPTYINKTVHKEKQFDEIYWRIYVKHQPGWIGNPAKMSRATSLASSKWTQAMIAHVWSSGKYSLTLDPVCGVKNGKVVTTKYNDFENMQWLGNRPISNFPIHSPKESGYWVCVESRVKLNTPGKKDGINQLWIDGHLECERKNLNLRGTYTKHGINAVFLEAYWNDGSPVTQLRWYDNFVISTKMIGPVVCPANPTIVKIDYRGVGDGGVWEVELSSDRSSDNMIYKSKKISPDSNRMIVNNEYGKSVGALVGKVSLTSGSIYYIRVRQSNKQGDFSNWSHWHQPFKVN